VAATNDVSLVRQVVTLNQEIFDLAGHESWEPAKVHRFLAEYPKFVREVSARTPGSLNNPAEKWARVADAVGWLWVWRSSFQEDIVPKIFGGDRHFMRLGRRDAHELSPAMKMEEEFGQDESGKELVRWTIPKDLMSSPFVMTKVVVDPNRPAFDKEFEGILIKGIKKEDQPYYLKRQYQGNGTSWGVNTDDPESSMTTHFSSHSAEGVATYFERLDLCAKRVLHHNSFLFLSQITRETLRSLRVPAPLQTLVLDYVDSRVDYPKFGEQEQAEAACEKEALYDFLYRTFFHRTIQTIFLDHEVLPGGRVRWIYPEQSQHHNGRFESREEMAKLVCDYADLATTPTPVSVDELPPLPFLQLSEPESTGVMLG
jgi:hypothetical protein